ncbi:hypothetical protein [Bacteroides sp. UBA939]|uniref:hypothetical protein n=1 Tax=Bacteroides sp. UBA939 TaxID=1946092 RepID=UPI0025C18E1A|nr:hypothetical protein [Bacteroides sp. UBA939]
MNKIEVNKPGYSTYAVLNGGKEIIKFSDNSDIVTDKESKAMPVVPKGKTQEIMFVPRGRNNNMMYDIMKKIGHNVTVGSNIEFKNKVIFGDGIMVYRKYRDKDTREIIKEEVLPEEEPDIFEFIENNNYSHIRHEIANDLAIFLDSYVEYLFDNNNPPRLVQIKSKEATCSRISEIDDTTGKSEWHGYSAEWHKGMPEDVIATKLLDRQIPLRDLKVRMGKLPNKAGKQEIVKDRNFIHNIRINTPGRFYYSRPYWWSVFASGWYDFSSAIPVYKKALIKNQMTLRYIIYIKDLFWEKLYKSQDITDDKKKAECREAFLKEMNDFLAGEENAGKAFVTEFRYDKIKGFEDKDIIIEPLKNEKIGGEYIEDSEEVSNILCYAMGVHPSIIGASPGKGKSINGTEARELFIIEQALMKMYQEATLEPLYFAKAVNDWPKDIYFSVTNCQLTTLDKGTGAQKNTGLTPETEEK